MRFGLLDDSGQALLNLGENQQRLATSVEELSTGLRINSAADDPSGLAIADSLQNVSNGLQEGQQQVQNANNALTVADGAMATITEILQRMRSLVVEANSDLESAHDQANIQAELDQLMLEINRVSGNTNFNGKTLLDGSLTSTPPQQAQALFIENPTVDNGGAGTQFIQETNNASYDGLSVSPFTEPVEFSFSVDSVDPTTGNLNVTVTAQSQDPTFGPPQVSQFQVAQGTNYPVGFPPPSPGAPTYVITDQAGNPVVSFNTNNLDANDVGKIAIVATTPDQSYQTGQALEVNVGVSEGDTIGVQIGAMNTLNLGLETAQVGDLLTNQATEGRVDNAIQIVTTQRAQLGAQEVSLNEAGSNAAEQYMQQVASESNIRDADVGKVATEFTKDQILTQVGTSVISQIRISSQALINLLLNSGALA